MSVKFRIGRILLTVKLIDIGRDLLRASIARMYIRALAGGIPPNPNAAWGRNFLASVPKC